MFIVIFSASLDKNVTVVPGENLRLTIKHLQVQATLLNPDMCNPDFRLNRTDGKVPVPSYTYNTYAHNPEFA